VTDHLSRTEPYNRKKEIPTPSSRSSMVADCALIVIGIGLPWSMVVVPIIEPAGTRAWLYLWKTYQNQTVVLPVIGELA
jgi:hypothetical protein